MEIGVLYLSHAMLVLAELIVCSTRDFSCILAKWFWPTVMSLSFTYGSAEASCSRRADTYFGRRSASLLQPLTKKSSALFSFFYDGFRNSYGRNNLQILVLHIVYRFVKWLWDLDSTFCLPMSLNGEIFNSSVPKFPRNVLRKSPYCQK